MPNRTALQRQLKAAEARYNQSVNTLAGLGPIRRGSIYQTRMKCGSSGCLCHRDPDARHGPYWLWTAKVNRKSKCRKLNPDALKLYQQQSKNYKTLNQTIQTMEALTEEITDCQLQLAALDSR
jgi:hypothetical protein